jgi:hypothetical protein
MTNELKWTKDRPTGMSFYFMTTAGGSLTIVVFVNSRLHIYDGATLLINLDDTTLFAGPLIPPVMENQQ